MRLRKIFILSTVIIAAGVAIYWQQRGDPVSDSRAECIPLSDKQRQIDKRGRYCLTGDLAVDEGLVIKSDFVSIDLGGYELLGPVGQTTTVGISGIDVSNVHITNGRIRGFGLAIQIYSNPHDRNVGFNQIENLSVSDSSQGGIHVVGGFTRLLNNSIQNIGGGPLLAGVHTHGVYLSGPGAIVQGNHFKDIYGSDVEQKTEGIALALSGYINGSLVSQNFFSNSKFLPDGQWVDMSRSTYAVWLGGNGLGSATVVQNQLENYINGIISDYHITAILIGNHAKNVAIPFSLREARREFGKKRAAGADGYTPADDGNRRPFGATVKIENTCEADDVEAARLGKLKAVKSCFGAYDISFDELYRAL